MESKADITAQRRMIFKPTARQPLAGA